MNLKLEKKCKSAIKQYIKDLKSDKLENHTINYSIGNKEKKLDRKQIKETKERLKKQL